MMDKVVFIQQEQRNQLIDYAIIEHADGSFTSMLKSHWDELEAAKENGTIS